MTADEGNLHSATEAELLETIGRQLLSGTFQGRRLSPSEYADVGRAWLNNSLPVLREKICDNPVIQSQLLSTGAAVRNAAAVEILDAVLHDVFSGIHVSTISHAVLCFGLYKLCGVSP